MQFHSQIFHKMNCKMHALRTRRQPQATTALVRMCHTTSYDCPQTVLHYFWKQMPCFIWRQMRRSNCLSRKKKKKTWTETKTEIRCGRETSTTRTWLSACHLETPHLEAQAGGQPLPPASSLWAAQLVADLSISSVTAPQILGIVSIPSSCSIPSDPEHSSQVNKTQHQLLQ